MQNRTNLRGFELMTTIYQGGIIASLSTAAFANLVRPLNLDNLVELGIQPAQLESLVHNFCITVASTATGTLWSNRDSFFSNPGQFILSSAISFGAAAGTLAIAKTIEMIAETDPNFALLISSVYVSGTVFCAERFVDHLGRSMRRSAMDARNA